MKKLSSLLVVLLLIGFVNCEPPKEGFKLKSEQAPVQASSQTQLTKERVEKALAKKLNTIKISGSFTVVGIQEIPGQNSARADIQYNDFEYSVHMLNSNVTRPAYTGGGSCVLTRYNDGKWSLTTIVIVALDIYNVNIPLE